MTESKVPCTPPKGGQPIRKRAYHRALKRGDDWAVLKKMVNDVLNKLSMRLIYGEQRQIIDYEKNNEADSVRVSPESP